jgi:hypothetical protein
MAKKQRKEQEAREEATIEQDGESQEEVQTEEGNAIPADTDKRKQRGKGGKKGKVFIDQSQMLDLVEQINQKEDSTIERKIQRHVILILIQAKVKEMENEQKTKARLKKQDKRKELQEAKKELLQKNKRKRVKPEQKEGKKRVRFSV